MARILLKSLFCGVMLVFLYLPSSTALALEDAAPLVIDIQSIDVGDQAWGQNMLKAKIKNTTDHEQPFWLHIGGEYQQTEHPIGFGMGMEAPIRLAPHEERMVKHPYWIPPQVGKLSYTVKCVIPADGVELSEQVPFFKKAYTITFDTPNHRCNELTPLAQFMKYDWAKEYRQGKKISSFEVAVTKHFIFYLLSDSPAKKRNQENPESARTDDEKYL